MKEATPRMKARSPRVNRPSPRKNPSCPRMTAMYARQIPIHARQKQFHARSTHFDARPFVECARPTRAIPGTSALPHHAPSPIPSRAPPASPHLHKKRPPLYRKGASNPPNQYKINQ